MELPTDMPRMPSFSSALLLGGKSTRMGVDKAWLEIEANNCRVPLWRRQLELLEELGPAEIFLSGEPRGAYPEGLYWVADQIRGIGPLGGLVSCLRRCQTEWLFVLAVDLPQMTAQAALRLLGARQPGKGVVPVLGNRFEPLIAVYPKLALATAERNATLGNYRMQGLAGELVRAGLMITYPVPCPDRPLFVNWNTPADRLKGNGPISLG